MPNILDPNYRNAVLKDINGDENKARKNESLRRSEVYNGRLRRFVNEKLLTEFSQSTVQEMRTVTSINITKRLIDSQASVYKREPVRNFEVRGSQLSDNELEQLENLYKYAEADVYLKKANRVYKLQRQAALQVIPKEGKIALRVLQPHNYDVIPRDDDPTKAYAYIVNVYDKSLLFNQTYVSQDLGATSNNYISQRETDSLNQVIADPDDGPSKERYIWWSDEYNFITNGHGVIIDELGRPLQNQSIEQTLAMIKNPIEKLPFIDIAGDKDFEFWSRQGDDTVQFNIDFLVLLSDMAELMKRQGYSQAIIYSEKPPANMLVGPNRILHIPLDGNKETQPRFEWSTPSPDLGSALKIVDNFVNFFMTAQNLDPKLISGTGDAQKFSSGIDRFLSMVQQAEAGQDDYALFRRVEDKVLELMVLWSNLMQGATIQNGVQPLIPELQVATISENVKVNVQFAGPEMIETRQDKEESVLRRLENGMISRVRAIMELEGVDEVTAKTMVAEIDSELVVKEDDQQEDQGEDENSEAETES